MLQQFSQTEIALRDTCLRYSDSESFDSLATMYGFPRPKSISVKAWRKAVRVVLFGPRGTFHTLYSFIKEALDDYTIKTTARGILTPLGKNEWLADGKVAGPLGADPLVKWNSIKSVFRILSVKKPTDGTSLPDDCVGRTIIYTSPSGKQLTMKVHKEANTKAGRYFYVPINETAYTNNPAPGEIESGGKADYGSLSILPFDLLEPNPGVFRSKRYIHARKQNVAQNGTAVEKLIWLNKNEDKFDDHHHTVLLNVHDEIKDVFVTPVTYVQELNEERWPGQPYGGQVQLDESKAGDPITSGPYPPYLLGYDLLGASQNRLAHALDQIMPDGCHLFARFDEGPEGFGYKNNTMGKTPSKTNAASSPLANSLQALGPQAP